MCVVAAAIAAPALAKPAPVTWCGGTEEIPGDRVPALDVASSDQVRFVYAVPSSEPDHFPDYASGIATDAAWIAEWWSAAWYRKGRCQRYRSSAQTGSATSG